MVADLELLEGMPNLSNTSYLLGSLNELKKCYPGVGRGNMPS